MGHQILIYDATPAMADVLSGTVPRPKVHCNGHWWHWAVKTLAGQKAINHLAIDINIKKPWCQIGEYRCSPWIEPDTIATEIDNQFNNAIDIIRDALGESLAGVFYCEKCHLDTTTARYMRSHQTFIAINKDGTRAASLQVI